MAATQFHHLFSPLDVGPMRLRNRIVSPPHGTGFVRPDGMPTERALHYWLSKARGGVALIGTYATPVAPLSTAGPPIAFQSDEIIPAYRRIADALHEEGACFVAQLSHPGRVASARPSGGATLAPSAIAPEPRRYLTPTDAEVPHAMEVSEIHAVVEAFRQAARRVRQAGFDAIEVQSAVGFLLAEFLSAAANRRTDEYGGNLENRLRFPFEVIDAIREGSGDDFCVGIRVDGDEFLADGLTLEDMKVIVPRLVEHGRLDYVSVAAGTGATVPWHVPSSYFAPGSLVYLASAIKAVAPVPVICVGRIDTPILAEEILERGHADLIAMNRAIIADPELPRKAREGRTDEIRRCIGGVDCLGRTRQGLPLACTVNPEAGREQEMALAPSATPKQVMVVGGGPAGLEAARVAALRGHHVSLYEREPHLGGQVNVAARAPGRDDLAHLRRYYDYQLPHLGVELHMNTEVTPQLVEQASPDAVVIATGSKSAPEGVASSKAISVVDAREVLTDQVEVGHRVLVVAGEHHIQALSVADFLAERGHQVELLTEAFYPGAQVDPSIFMTLIQRIMRSGVVITPLTRVREVAEQVVVENAITGEAQTAREVDAVVVASAGQADTTLYRSLKGKVRELHRVGDCLSPRGLSAAVLDGARVGRLL